MKVSFRKQLKVWKSVLFALFLREMQSQFNDKLGLAWAFLEPFAFIFGLSYMRSMMGGGDVHSIPVFIFMMIGMISIQSFMTPINTTSNAFKRNKPLYAFRQVQPISALLVSGFVEFSIKIVVITLAGIALYLLKIQVQIDNPILLICMYFSLWIFTISISCIVGIIVAYLPEFHKITGLLTRPLFFISCIFFSLQDIPMEYWHYLTWNPLVHFIELSRFACFESYGSNGVSIGFALGATFTAFFFALCLYHLTWKGILSR
ncbi:ABC transporter [Aestuariibacter sp. GS-14]|uniref:ABC transporter permease n=1 Tax=Aestuariibacter sp. GS-14 TaxID=2590670 RepID=UPI00112C9D7C|nr:ABC transporter permease [Aestuariibacter sp. GS-14]TPV56082.1 ABC transporter [Aestuariibacter sp. GS-14]